MLSWLLDNLGKKILAILIAIGTWLAIRDATSFEHLIADVPLTILLDEGWAIQERSVSEVNILVRGSQLDVRFLTRDQMEVVLDLTRFRHEDVGIYELTPSMVRAPKAVRAVQVDPGEVRLVLDREQEKLVPVVADILGQPPEGFVQEGVVVTPSNVVLRGPAQRIAGVESVKTVPLDLEGRLRSFQLNRNLVPPSEAWSARMDPPQVRVEVRIVERSLRRDYTNVMISALLPPGAALAAEFFPPSVNVALRGRSDVVTNLTPGMIRAFVDFGDLSVGSRSDLPVQVPAPGGVEILAIDPPVVRADLRMATEGQAP
ncbi:MAG TPA: CdaR family protein [Kiritimatiellia bacterium]|nr:CdaR family protein [Kiritimatiellia bacterium]